MAFSFYCAHSLKELKIYFIIFHKYPRFTFMIGNKGLLNFDTQLDSY
jgi:hypothetical protein